MKDRNNYDMPPSVQLPDVEELKRGANTFTARALASGKLVSSRVLDTLRNQLTPTRGRRTKHQTSDSADDDAYRERNNAECERESNEATACTDGQRATESTSASDSTGTMAPSAGKRGWIKLRSARVAAMSSTKAVALLNDAGQVDAPEASTAQPRLTGHRNS